MNQRIPVIGIEEDPDEGIFILTAKSYGRVNPAGERLFRGGDFPLINWTHQNMKDAEADRDKLQAYVNVAFGEKGASKKQVRELGAD